VTAPARPLYFRLLGVKHLRAGPVAAFVLFEGSIAAGALLALADVVSWWGSIAIPVAVAVMVKINDRVARALVQPLAVVQMSASRPLRDRRMIGRSAVPAPARLTTEIASDDAIASPDAWPDRADPTAIGTASVTSIGRAPVPGPGISSRPSGETAEGPPGPRSPSPEEQAGRADQTGQTEQTEQAGQTEQTGQSEPDGQDWRAKDEGQSEHDGWLSMRAEGRADRMDRLDPESRARGNQGHFG
jgi:hypothetical protein